MNILKKIFFNILISFLFSLTLIQPLVAMEGEPAFVVNTPFYIPSESEGETTSSENARNFQFTEHDFENPPYVINAEKRGTMVEGFLYIKDGEIVGIGDLEYLIDNARRLKELNLAVRLRSFFKNRPSSDESDISNENGTLRSFLKIFNETAFESEQERNERIQNIKFVIGFNRPRSLSSKKNNLLYKELENCRKMNRDGVCVCAFLWDFPWCKFIKNEDGDFIRNKSGKIKFEEVSYEEVLSFYRQLKKRDKNIDENKAREFRKQNESLPRNRMVPYRSIREKISNRSYTKHLVRLLRRELFNPNVYLFLCDPDTVSFNGCFSSYFDIARESSPDAMTTGYLYDSDKPMIKIASELDMIVREATERHLRLAVYPPEPSICVKVLPGFDTIEGSFKVLNHSGKIERDYSTPKEGPNLLNSTSVRRPEFKFVFAYSDRNTLITKTPGRAMLNKRGGPLTFSATLNVSSEEFNREKRKFVNWEMEDFNRIKNVSQSHSNARSWALNLLNCFNKVKRFNNIPSGLARNISISLLSRLFNSYDLISLAKDDKNKLFHIISDYEQCVSSDEISKYKSAGSRNHTIWKKIDNIDSRRKILKILNKLLIDFDAEGVNLAARTSGKSIKEFLLRNFCFDLNN